MSSNPTDRRLHGLDLARLIALVGMVIVNFDIVMVHAGDAVYASSRLAESLQGRAAATFVVLAGIGLGLAARRGEWNYTFAVTVKRAVFLLVLGLLNSMIFEADIIHYYAVYFLFGALLLRAPSFLLWCTIIALVVGFVAMATVLDYARGWNWSELVYDDFWSPQGFLRNLFFNGWHPVVPWLAFLLFGIWLSRQKLRARPVQTTLAVAGTVTLLLTTAGSTLLIEYTQASVPEAEWIFGTAAIPPMPLYMIAGGSAACLVIGLSLLLAPRLKSAGILDWLTPAGRQTLTLYIAHILIGMGLLEALGMIGGQTGELALLAAALFCLMATVYAALWTRWFKRGPLEALMRRVAG